MPPKTKPEAKPKSEAKPTTTPAATPKAESKPKAEAKPAAPKAESKPKAEAKPPAAPKTESKPKAETKPAAASKTETKKAETKKVETKKAETKTTTTKASGSKGKETKTETKAPAKLSTKQQAKAIAQAAAKGKVQDKKRKAPEGGAAQTQKKSKTVEGESAATTAKSDHHVGQKKPRNFSIGNAIQPKRDLTRFMKWPRYIVMQRKKRVLQQRLKVPPAINQFTRTLDTNTAANLFKLLNKYRPESAAARQKRLMRIATGRANPSSTKPLTVKCGINHVTKLIEEKKASLVVISHDVDPIELVLYLPALCRKQNIPYCFVKGKARLGRLVHKKTATAVALKGVRAEDKQQFGQLVGTVRTLYNDKYEEMKKKWGGGIMGLKSQAVTRKKDKLKKTEEKKKLLKFK